MLAATSIKRSRAGLLFWGVAEVARYGTTNPFFVKLC